MSNKSNTQAIAIIGMACYYAGAQDLKQLWENILAKRRQFRKFPNQRLPLSEYYDADPKASDKTYGSMAAVIDGFEFDWIKRRVPKTVFESTDVAHWLALEVALKALEDSGYNSDNLPNEKTGVIVGNTLTGEQTRAETMRLRWPFVRKALEASAKAKGMSPTALFELTAIMEKYYKSVFAPITEDSLAGGLSNTISGRICNYLDLQGGAYTVDGACSSSVVAVANAALLLNNHDLDLAFAGGVDISLDTFELIGFSKTGALTSKDMTVYDKKASGFIPGEGCGFVIMKRLEDAQRDKDYIYAILNGWGLSTDGKGGITAPKSAGQATAIKRAYDRAGYSMKEIDFIEGHGTGTAVGDRVELNGIALALGDDALPRSCGVTSFKSIVGHTKAASGIGGFIKAVMAVNQRIIPPVANCSEPNPVFDDSAKSLYPIIQGEIRDPKAILKAGITGAGFGGENCHLTIVSGNEPTAKLKPSIPERSLLVSHQNTELFVLSGSSISNLNDRLKTIKSLAEGMSFGEMVDLAARLSRELNKDYSVRAAIIADSPNNLLKNLEQLGQTLEKNPPREGEIFTSPLKDIWAGNSVQKTKVGFLFPGQGSQQLNMARTLVERHLWAQELLKDASKWIGKINDKSIEEFIYKSLDRSFNSDQTKQWYQELTQTQVAQPAICLASLFWTRQLRNLGIEPVVVGGHSLGELTAFHAAGAYDEERLLKLAAIRGKAMASPATNPGAMASLACSLETTSSLIKERNGNGYVAIANINSPEQIVISGNRSSVEAVVELAGKENINAKLLPVSNAFHSKLVANASEELKNNAPIPELAENIKVHVFSGVDGVSVVPGFKLREHFATQVIAQVNFVSLVQSLSTACDVVVEVGPGKILSNLVSTILGDNDIECFPVESKPENDKDLNTFLGCYFTHGGNINWRALYENRLVHPFVPASEKIFIENPCERPFKISEVEVSQTVSAGNGFESILSQKSNFTQQQLSEYFSHRGQFIEAVIKADLQNMPSQLTMQNISDRPIITNDSIITDSNATNQKAANQNIESKAESISKILLEKVSNKTGFPVETLTLELHLLDDLNLDSIKSAELIAEVRKQLGITQQLDPTKFANASLGDVVNILEGYVKQDKKSKASSGAESVSVSNVLLNKVAQKTGFPIETLPMDLRLLDDLNLDSIKSAELIIEVKKHLGIAQKLDPATFANASLGDVVTILEKAIASEEKIQEIVAPDGRESWVRNFILKPIQQPISDITQDVKSSFENVLIVSEPEEVPIANALKNKLKSQSVNVYVNNFSEIATKEQSDTNEPTDIIVILPQNPDLDTPIHDRLKNIVLRLHTTVNLPLKYQQLLKDKSLTCIQFGGQYFGTGSKVYDIEQGCAKALLASFHLEHPELKTKIIDFDQNVDVDFLTEKVIVEMMLLEKYEAVCYDAQLTRHVLRASTHDPSSYRDRKIQWSADDVILVTGGAKGITAECAFTFAKSTGVKMALVGSSSYALNDTNGQNEIARTMERYEQNELVCNYYQCDIANTDAVINLVEIIRREMGEITGVVHGAGINKPRPVSSVTVEDAYQEIVPKVIGALNLINAFQNRQLKLFVGLTSIIGVSGMKGNAWYGFSNEALDLLLGKFQADHPQTAVSSLAYSVWSEVGMGARMGSTHTLAAMGIDSIPPNAGVERFLQIVNNDPEERQVIIAARFSGLDTLSPEASFPMPKASRFLEQVVYYYPGIEVTARAHLTLEKESYVKDHVWRGSHLFPTVFGLEAMAQAVAYVTGENDFQHLRIEDIHLDRPIVVNPENGIDIQIRAEVLEGESANGQKKVHVGIATEQSDFERDHFSATFIFINKSTIPQKQIRVNQLPLDIVPKDDLYGWLLFQGPQFQRLQQVYNLDSKKCFFSSEKRSYSPNNEDGTHYILGDPFFRDSLLQSPQLVLSQDLCLPVYIESIEIYPGKNKSQDSYQGYTELETVRDKKVRVYTDAIDENGAVTERLNGYTLQILEHHDEFPTPEQIADPSEFDTAKINEEISNRLKSMNANLPEITLSYLQGLHNLSKDERRQRELPIMEKTVEKYIDRNNKNIRQIQIDWLDTGQPVLANGNDEEIGISISHDDRACLCVAGSGAQGCDLAPITSRSREDWMVLLGADQETMVDKLINSGDHLDRAGTRIWATKEALVKAYGLPDFDLEIAQQDNDCILFKSSAQQNQSHVLTFPVALTRNPERIIAIVVKVAESQQQSNIDSATNSQVEKFRFDKDIYAADLEIGSRNEPIYIFRFPITFRETANISNNLYYSNYFNWMGKIREYPLKPVYEQLVEEFTSGKWGMVTNSAETTIYGEAKSGDVIEGRLWMDNISGSHQSTLDMRFEWRKVRSDGDYEVIAHSKMKATYVAIVGHGMVEIKPFPEFIQDFVNEMLPLESRNLPAPKTTHPLKSDVGRALHQEPAGPVQPSSLVHEETIQTSLEDSNLVGNIYFANYYAWQGRVRDNYLYKIAPEIFDTSNKYGEFRCVNCKIEHVREAMPFDRILVKLYRRTVHEKGIKFYFDYYRVNSDGKHEKLAYGEHEAVWYAPDANGKWLPSAIPAGIREALINSGGNVYQLRKAA